MSRGPGVCQRAILSTLERVPFAALSGSTRSEDSAMPRAATALQKASKCVLVRLCNDDHTHVVTHVVTHVARPGFVLSDGTPLQNLSVERVPGVTGSTFKGSIRHMARQERVSP